MTAYRITGSAGIDYGTYHGDTPDAAFRAMVTDGGDGVNIDGHSTSGTTDDWYITEVEYVIEQRVRETGAWEPVPAGGFDSEEAAQTRSSPPARGSTAAKPAGTPRRWWRPATAHDECTQDRAPREAAP